MLKTISPPNTLSTTQAERTRPPAEPNSACPNCATNAVLLDVFHGNDGDEGQADEQIERRHDQDAGRERDGEGARGIAYFAGDLARLPPSAEGIKGADRGAGDGADKGVRSRPALGKG